MASGGRRISVYEYHKTSEEHKDDTHEFKLVSEACPTVDVNVTPVLDEDTGD